MDRLAEMTSLTVETSRVSTVDDIISASTLIESFQRNCKTTVQWIFKVKIGTERH